VTTTWFGRIAVTLVLGAAASARAQLGLGTVDAMGFHVRPGINQTYTVGSPLAALDAGRGFVPGAFGVTGVRQVNITGAVYGCGPGFGHPGFGWGGIGYNPWLFRRGPVLVGPFDYFTAGGVWPPQYGGAQSMYLYGLEQQNALLRQEITSLRQAPAAAPANPNAPANPAPNANNPTLAQRQRNIAQRARQAVDAGTRLFAAEQYSLALEKFRQATKLAPNDPAARLLITQTLVALRRYGPAADSIRETLKATPAFADADFDASALYADRDRLDRHLADLARELKARPADRSAMLVLGQQLFVTGERERARTILEQTARLEADGDFLKPFFQRLDREDADQAAVQPANANEPAPKSPPPAPTPVANAPGR
jgi:hypothetical protein